MGKKRSGRQDQQASFSQMLQQQSLNKVKPYLDQQIAEVARILSANLNNNLEEIYIRVVALEKILMNKFNVEESLIIETVADIQDEKDGLKKSLEAAKEQDTVRIEVSTKAKDQAEFQGTSKLVVSRLGSGQTLGKALEGHILGMKSDETKEVNFGQNDEMVAKITVNRVSSPLKKQEAPKKDEAQKEASQ